MFVTNLRNIVVLGNCQLKHQEVVDYCRGELFNGIIILDSISCIRGTKKHNIILPHCNYLQCFLLEAIMYTKIWAATYNCFHYLVIFCFFSEYYGYIGDKG